MEDIIHIFLQEYARMSVRIAELERENKELQEKFTKITQEITDHRESYVTECEKKLTEAVDSHINLMEMMEDQEETPAACDVNTEDANTVKQVSIQSDTVTEKTKVELRKEYMRTYMKKKRDAKKTNGNSAEKV